MLLLKTISFVLHGELIESNFNSDNLTDCLNNVKCVYIEILGKPNTSIITLSKVVNYIDNVLDHNIQYAWNFNKDLSCKENELVVRLFQGGKKCT